MIFEILHSHRAQISRYKNLISSYSNTYLQMAEFYLLFFINLNLELRVMYIVQNISQRTVNVLNLFTTAKHKSNSKSVRLMAVAGNNLSM